MCIRDSAGRAPRGARLQPGSIATASAAGRPARTAAFTSRVTAATSWMLPASSAPGPSSRSKAPAHWDAARTGSAGAPVARAMRSRAGMVARAASLPQSGGSARMRRAASSAPSRSRTAGASPRTARSASAEGVRGASGERGASAVAGTYRPRSSRRRAPRPVVTAETGWVGREDRAASRGQARTDQPSRFPLSGRFLLQLVLVGGVQDDRLALLEDDLLGDHHLARGFLGRDVVHHVEHRGLEDGSKAAGPGLAADGLGGDGLQRPVGELQRHPVEVEQLPVLLHQRVLRLAEDAHQGALVQLLQRGDDRQPADELGDHPELEEVLGLHVLQELGEVPLLLLLDVRTEAEGAAAEPPLDDLVQPAEGAAADEEDVGGVDLQELLLRVLASALR